MAAVKVLAALAALITILSGTVLLVAPPAPLPSPAAVFHPAVRGTNGPAAALTVVASREGTWYPTYNPPIPGRNRAGMADDPALGGLVLFGGYNPTTYGFFNDTWLLKNGSWSELTPAHSPSIRSTMTLAYDSSDQEVLLFGGHSPSGDLNDTWTFASNATWVSHPTPSGLSIREGYALCDDPPDHGVLLFGGDAGTVSAPGMADTWLFRAGAWTELSPAVSPPARTDTQCGWDAQTQEDVLFGGVTTNPPAPFLDDTWAFRSGDWVNLTQPGPSPRIPNSLAPNPAGGLVTFTGACATTCGNDTWELWNGTWKLLAESTHPEPVGFSDLAYDPATNATFIAGGSIPYGSSSWTNQTWEWAIPTVTVSTPADEFDLGGTAQTNVSAGPAIGGGNLTVVWGDGSAPTVYHNGSLEWRPSHTYAKNGTYRATFTVSDDRRQNTTADVTFQVQSLPTATVVVTPVNGSAPLTVGLSATAHGGVGPFSWSWLAGDGSTAQTASTTAGSLSASHQYTKDGSFELQLTVQDAEGHVSSATANVTVTAAPPPPTHHNNTTGPPTAATIGTANPEPWVVWLVLAGAIAGGAVVAVLVTRVRRP